MDNPNWLAVVISPLVKKLFLATFMDDRLQSEQVFHDLQAAQRREAWQCDPSLLKFAPEAYLDHEPWVRPALAKLGSLHGKRVLDFGCGHGMAAIILAQQGGNVTAFDLSTGYVHEATQRAEANRVSIQTVIADGNRLPFAKQTFDAIWGVAILHHLSLDQAVQEIKRVLKPEGIAVFCEPWGGNPFLSFARRCLPYQGKEHTRDERPLLTSDLQPFQSQFNHCEIEYVQLLGMIRRAWKTFPLLPILDRWDSHLIQRWPQLGHWCRYIVLLLRP